MIIDFRDADVPLAIETDLCIIGAGAAGITIANAYARSNRDVCLLESGGLEFEADTQALYSGPLVGHNYHPIDAIRLRYFGGTTNHWTGWCAPLNDTDFEPRAWVPSSGWPIRRSELEPYYLRAQPICGIGPFKYLASDWPASYEHVPAFDAAKLVARVWQISPPIRFGQKYRESLAASRCVRVLLHANAVELVPNESSQAIREVRIRSLAGKSATVRARRFVLACGGMENARLLLASKKESGGLGNARDLVGRYFMDHTEVTVGTLAQFDPNMIRELEVSRAADGTNLLAAFCPSTEIQSERRLLNYAGWIHVDRDDRTGYDAAISIARDLRSGTVPSDLDSNILRVIRDFDTLVGAAYGKLGGDEYEPQERPIKHVRLGIACEQSPNPLSRVRLTEEVDALGMNRIAFDWRFQDLDLRTARTAAKVLAEEFSRAGACRVKLDEWVLDDKAGWPDDMRGGFHHMGTTRMSASPTTGVVNSDCRIHGLDNLYVAGSSVFSASGYANPTLTIVAMALRLVDHLDRQQSL